MPDSISTELLQLIARARDGEPEAVDELWRQLYESPPKWFATSLIKRGVSRQDVKDALHELYLKGMETLGKIEQPAAFPAIMFRTIQTVARQQRSRNRSVELTEQVANRLIDESAQVDYDLRDALIKLRSDLAGVIRLVYLEGYTYDEAAELLGRTPRQIKRMVTSGLADLRRLLSAKVSAGFFFRDPNTGYKTTSRQLPLGDYRVGIILQNTGEFDVTVAANLRIGAESFAVPGLRLCKHSVVEPILPVYWTPRRGRHLAQLDLTFDGWCAPQKICMPIDVGEPCLRRTAS
jgi:RNA polymerase sigma factor (sigma-70 family)